MVDAVADVAIAAAQPGPDEAEMLRETVALMDREMLMTADADMVIVRVFGSDKTQTAVRIGVSPERAMRIGAAFFRAAVRIKPALRLQIVDDEAKPGGADLKLVTGEA